MCNTLRNFVKSKDELTKSFDLINGHVSNMFKNCLNKCFDSNLNSDESDVLKIDSVLDFVHDEINTGHWKDVSISTRRAYTAASFVKAIILLQTSNSSDAACKEALKCIDLGLLLGAPLEHNSDLLTDTASFLSQTVDSLKLPEINDKHISTRIPKRKLNEVGTYERLDGEEIAVLQCPSLEEFNDNYFQKEIPVKLQDCVSHWPAITKWHDANYLLKIAGSRTVPVEIGSHYADEKWSQKLMTMQEFITKYFLSDKSESLGYLAQHNLFDQIVELRNDIREPEYCCLSRDYDSASEPDVNAWFGPQGTVSPLHQDPKDNLLVQVFGTKQIVLYSPNDSEFLYPHDDKLLITTARADPINPDYTQYPKFRNAVMYKCLLEPGEMLYIPPKWWHHVTALDKSFSVSFWWK